MNIIQNHPRTFGRARMAIGLNALLCQHVVAFLHQCFKVSCIVTRADHVIIGDRRNFANIKQYDIFAFFIFEYRPGQFD